MHYSPCLFLIPFFMSLIITTSCVDSSKACMIHIYIYIHVRRHGTQEPGLSVLTFLPTHSNNQGPIVNHHQKKKFTCQCDFSMHGRHVHAVCYQP